MANEAEKMGMGEGTAFLVTGPRLFGMIHAAAAQAAYAERERPGSVIAYADGVKRWFDANPEWVRDHRIPGQSLVGAELVEEAREVIEAFHQEAVGAVAPTSAERSVLEIKAEDWLEKYVHGPRGRGDGSEAKG